MSETDIWIELFKRLNFKFVDEYVLMKIQKITYLSIIND